MKTSREAKVFVYRQMVAFSLRKHLHDERCLPKGLTPAGLKRVQREMERLASWLEAKAAKYEAIARLNPPRSA